MSNDRHKQTVNFLECYPRRWRINISFHLAMMIVMFFLFINIVLSGLLLGLNINASYDVSVERERYNEKNQEITHHNQSIVKVKGEYLGRIPSSYRLSHKGFYDLLKELSEHDLKQAWLTEIFYDYVGDVVRFNGFGETPSSVNNFLTVLKKMKSLENKKFELFVLHNTSSSISGESIARKKREKNPLEEKVTYVDVNGKTMKKTVIGEGLKVRFDEVEEGFDLEDMSMPTQEVSSGGRDMKAESIYQKLITQSMEDENGGKVKPYIFTIQNSLKGA